LKARRGKFGRRESGGSAQSARGGKARVAQRGPHTAPSPAAVRGSGSGALRRSSAAGGAAAVKPGALVEGTVSANRAGYGFLRVEGFKDSVFLPPPQMRGVMHGDRVRVKVARDASDRWSGVVDQVLERGVSAFLGTVEVQGRSASVSAADRRLQLRCVVAPQDLHGARGGDWVIAKVTRHAGSASAAEAVVVKRLDPCRPVELATESAIARFDLPYEFPSAARAGDRIVAIGAQPVKDLNGYMAVIAKHKPGTPVEVTLVRNGVKKKIKVVPE